MKLKYLRKISLVTRRILKLVNKKSTYLKRIATVLIVLPLVIPVGAMSAADSKSVETPIPEVTIKTDFVGDIYAPQVSSVSFETQKSNYQQKLTVRVKAAQIVAVKTVLADASFEQKRALAKSAAAAWGIDWKILEAVWQIESGKSWETSVRSYAGAQGPCQFMPGTWGSYAQDGNGDGSKSVYKAEDCLYAAAKLLAVNGASNGNVTQALLRYNHSIAYVNKVLGIAKSIEG